MHVFGAVVEIYEIVHCTDTLHCYGTYNDNILIYNKH